MIFVVTGRKNSGKTTFMKKLFLNNKDFTGFLTEKYYVKNVFYGYKLFFLENKSYKNFILKKEYFDEQWKNKYVYKNFIFNQDVFNEIEVNSENFICKNNVIIDEVGPIELEKRGFFNVIKFLTKNCETNLYFSVRTSCLTNFIKFFNIKNCKIIFMGGNINE